MARHSALSTQRSKASLPSEVWDRLESLLQRFEDAWRRGERPTLDDYLQEAGPGERHVLLVELAHADLDYRLRAGEAARVEDYLSRHPELREDAAALVGLVLAEHVLRQGRGETAALAEYQTRFPEYADLLRQRLAGPSRSDAPTGDGAGASGGTPAGVESRDRASPEGGGETVSPSQAVVPPATLPLPGSRGAAGAGAMVSGYEILGELGRGGMGVVYKARQAALGRLVALKMILHADYAAGEAHARFRAEAQAVARLQHPNIVQVFEVGEAGGLPYFSLEYCPGGGLDRKLGGTPLPAADAARLVETLARAIDAAHRANVVHRDLKPANVLLTAEGEPKVTDFGLAKKLDVPGQTQTGALLGTPSYMAPEQARGQKGVGPAADTYALGAILYECLTGRPPFRGPTILDTMEQVCSQEPAAVRQLNPAVPRDLETICHQCLRKEPHRRYASAAHLAEDLGRFLRGEPVRARPVGLLERGGKWVRRNPLPAGALATVLLTFLGSFSWVLSAYHTAEVRRIGAEQAEVAKDLALTQRGEALEKEKNAHVQADQARVQAEQARGEVEGQRERSEQALYGHQLGQASLALEEGDAPRALALLDECRWDLRHWEWRYLRRLAAADSQTVTLFHGLGSLPQGGGVAPRTVVAAFFSSDGRELVSVASGWPLAVDSEVKIWDAETGREKHTIRLAANAIEGAALSPDGRKLATLERSGAPPGTVEIRLRELPSGEEVRTLRRNGHSAVSIAFGSDGSWLATGGREGVVCVWDTATGRERCTFTGHRPAGAAPGFTLPVPHLSVRSDGRRVASRAGGGPPLFWDPTDGRTVEQALPPNLLVRAAGWAGDRLVLQGMRDGQPVVVFCHAATAQELFRVSGLTGALSFSADGRSLAAVERRRARVWDGSRQKSRAVPASGVRLAALAPDGRRLVLGVELGRLQLRRVGEGAERSTVVADRARSDGPPAGAAADTVIPLGNPAALGVRLCEDGRRLFSIHTDNRIRVWDLASGRQLSALPTGRFDAVPPGTPWAAVSADGQRVAARSGTGASALVWDAGSGRQLGEVKSSQDVQTLALDRRGDRLALAMGPSLAGGPVNTGELGVWDVKTGERVLTARGAEAANIVRLHFHPSAPLLYTFTFRSPSEPRAWDLATGKPAANAPTEGVEFFTAWSADARLVACAPRAGDTLWVRVSDGSTGALRWSWPLSQDADGIRDLTFSPDGRRLAGTDGTGHVHVWGVDVGQQLLSLEAHPGGSAEGVAFGPDSRTLYTWGEEGPNHRLTVRRWDAPVRPEPQPLGLELLGRMSLGTVDSAAFDRAGAQLALACDAGVQLWDLHRGRLLLTRRRGTPHQEVGGDHVAFAPSGDLLAGTEVRMKKVSQGPGGSAFYRAAYTDVFVWQTSTGRDLWSVRLDGVYHGDLAFTPDNRLLAGAAADGLRLWDVRRGEQVRFIPWPAGDGGGIVFGPDGRHLAATTSRQGVQEVRVWETDSGREVCRLADAGRNLRALGFDETGRLYCEAAPRNAGAGELRIFAAGSDREVLRRPLPVPAWGAKLAPDGRSLVLAGPERGMAPAKVVLCDAETGNPRLTADVAHRGNERPTRGWAFEFLRGGRLAVFVPTGVVYFLDVPDRPGRDGVKHDPGRLGPRPARP